MVVGLTLDTVGLLDIFGLNKSLLVAVVPDGDVGTSLGEAMGDSQTNTSASAGDNGSAALEREHGHDTVTLGDVHVVMGEGTVLHVDSHLDCCVCKRKG